MASIVFTLKIAFPTDAAEGLLDRIRAHLRAVETAIGSGIRVDHLYEKLDGWLGTELQGLSRDELLGQDWHVLGLRRNVVRGLERSLPTVRTLGELISRERAQLLAFPGFGETTLRDLENRLAVLGLAFEITAECAAEEITEQLTPDTPIEQTGLRACYYQRLRAALPGVRTARELSAYTAQRILLIPRIGSIGLQEVQEALARCGLRLDGES